MRLHATGGYLTVRHAVMPGMILTLAAGAGLCWLTNQVSIPGRWLGLAHERFRLGPAVWVVVIAALVIVPYVRSLGPAHPGPFAVYYTTGDWLAANTRPEEKVLDLTDWSLFFSGRDGYHFADVYKAPADPRMRWIVIRKPDDRGPLALQQDHRRALARQRGRGPAPGPGFARRAADQHLRSPEARSARGGRARPIRREQAVRALAGESPPPIDHNGIEALTDESLDLDSEIRRTTGALDHRPTGAHEQVLLMAIAAALLLWQTGHTETSFADGLRYIHQAERIEAGSWHDVALQGTDHPLHPLLIAAMHRLWAARARPRGKEPRSGCRSLARFCSSSRFTC